MSESAAQPDRSPVKQALLEMRRMRERIEEMERAQHAPVAIVGAGVRLPGGVQSLDDFWRLLVDGVDTITEVPPERWDLGALYSEDRNAPGRMYCRHGAFIDDVAAFDAAFFGISPREAETMDPQQRLVLETGWEALEQAGISPRSLKGSATGIFLGSGNSDYLRMVYERRGEIDAYATSGSTPSIAASRLSYLLDLHGPSVAIDTACSASLVAIHQALRSLRSGECDMALAGGVNLILSPELTINFCKAGMLAPDGRCKTFDAAADGYVRGEGCAMIVLKRLDDALSAGDNILAVIRGSAVNQDGRTSGITAPNGPAQESVIRAALQDARVEAAEVGYVEAHGTGTSLGDPIEAQALGATYGASHRGKAPLVVGSVKTNMGHLELAAGVVGLLKAALCVNRGMIPPHLHFKTPNPHLDLQRLNLSVPAQSAEWREEKRLAGVSSFGFSGTNAHVILESPPRVAEADHSSDRTVQVLTVSAKDTAALEQLAQSYAADLAARDQEQFADYCHTANVGRAHYTHRIALVAATSDDAVKQLSQPSAEAVWRGWAEEGTRLPVAFLFTGQGAQYSGMARELYGSCQPFKKAIDECAQRLEGLLDTPLTTLLNDEPERINQTRYAQVAVFAIEYALARLLQSWGIQPSFVMGHSLGEYVAACVAGIFTLEDALRLIVRRGELTGDSACAGKMAAVFAGARQVSEILSGLSAQCSIAADNGPDSTVISGEAAAVEEASRRLLEKGIEVRPLEISSAFHSPRMRSIAQDFRNSLNEISMHAQQIPLVSNLTGKICGEEIRQPEYWVRHLLEPVQFSQSIQTLLDNSARVLVEIGPHPILTGMARRFATDESLLWLPTLQRDGNDWLHLLESLAQFYSRGGAVDWKAVDAGLSRKRLSIPTYPFQRSRHWLPEVTQPQIAEQPSWPELTRAAEEQASQGPLDLKPELIREKWRELELLATAAVSDVLEADGCLKPALSLDEVMSRSGISETYRHLVKRWLALIEKNGAMPGCAQVHLKRCVELFSDAPRFMAYIQRCLHLLPGIVHGQQNPLETLFPDGSPEEAEWLYGEWSVSLYFNNIIRSAVASIAGRPLRILEIGAGTGGTARRVLPVLRNHVDEYWFTDMSEFFFNRARQRFGDHDFVRYEIFDAERSPEEQNVPTHYFDYVIASNAIHATKNLDKTLANVRSLLKSDGVFLLYEVTEHPAWFDISTGLIEGWQRFDDEWRMNDTPLLSVELWHRTLKQNGFAAVESFPSDGQPTSEIGHHVFAALAPQVASGVAPAAPQPTPQIAKEQPAQDDARPEVAFLSLPERERHAEVVRVVREHVARVLRLPAEKAPGAQARLMDAGIDSLMSLELKARLENAFGLKGRVSSTLIFDYPTADAIATLIERLAQPEGGQTDVKESPDVINAADLAALSDAEVETMLLSSLDEGQSSSN